MNNWTYIGTSNFGDASGVSLNDYEYDEVLVIASVNDFDIYLTSGDLQPLLSNPSIEFYWIPDLGAVQLSQSIKDQDTYPQNKLLITISFGTTNVRTSTVLVIDCSDGSTTDYNAATHGHIDVYCR